MSDFQFTFEMPDVTDEALKMLYMKTMEHRVAIMKERDELKEENEKLKKENEELTDELEDLEQVREENEQLTEELEDLEEVREDRDEMYEENKKLKEKIDELEKDKKKYFGYLKDKDLECENQRERADHNEGEMEKLIEEKDALKEEMKSRGLQNTEKFEEMRAEIKELKEEVIAERKKVAEGNRDRWFVGEMWRAESVFLNMPSAKEQPEEFNDFLKEEFDEDMYKEMYEEFNLAEFLECSESDEEESDDSE